MVQKILDFIKISLDVIENILGIISVIISWMFAWFSCIVNSRKNDDDKK